MPHKPDLTLREATFDEAFAKAREIGVAVFRWRGGEYHTRTAEEEARTVLTRGTIGGEDA